MKIRVAMCSVIYKKVLWMSNTRPWAMLHPVKLSIFCRMMWIDLMGSASSSDTYWVIQRARGTPLVCTQFRINFVQYWIGWQAIDSKFILLFTICTSGLFYNLQISIFTSFLIYVINYIYYKRLNNNYLSFFHVIIHGVSQTHSVYRHFIFNIFPDGRAVLRSYLKNLNISKLNALIMYSICAQSLSHFA